MLLLTICIIPMLSNDNPLRSPAADLRRAAGSQSLERLQTALCGWEADEIDADRSGKSPVHMAAWKGSLKNLKYLIDEVGCNIDVVSQGEFSYGKTPIFFALTQSRPEVVTYLLDCGCNVKIVNNKGQTPLSIASSHLSNDIVQRIQELESADSRRTWCNYRQTHSDGLEYGDLDPRFLDRPLRDNDSVTAYAVNPTTKTTRKGNFRRNNPSRAAGNQAVRSLRRRRAAPTPHTPAPLSESDQTNLDKAWHAIEQKTTMKESDINLVAKALRTIVRLSDQQRYAWIPAVNERLRAALSSESTAMELIQCARCEGDASISLLDRLEKYCRDPNAYGKPQHNSNNKRQNTVREASSLVQFQKAWEHVRHLFIEELEQTAGPFLSLPIPPIWVDSIESLEDMMGELQQNASVISFDSEWCDGDGTTSPSVSTLQLAVANRSWIVDCTVMDAGTTSQYQSCLRQSLIRLWERTPFLLGFAVSQDLRKLSELAGSDLSRSNVLDLQYLWATPGTAGSLPGLQVCVAMVLASDVVALDKSQQCSEWQNRPLSREQMNYAGLDAVVLNYLLAEYGKQQGGFFEEDG